MCDHGMCDHGMCDHVLSLQGELKMVQQQLGLAGGECGGGKESWGDTVLCVQSSVMGRGNLDSISLAG